MTYKITNHLLSWYNFSREFSNNVKPYQIKFHNKNIRTAHTLQDKYQLSQKMLPLSQIQAIKEVNIKLTLITQ